MIDVKKLQLFNKSIYGNSVVGSLNANTLQFTKTGNPWWGESNTIEPPISSSGNIKRILKVNWANVKTANKAIGH